jgi:hypothetical protein
VRGAKRVPVASLQWWIEQKERSHLSNGPEWKLQGAEKGEKPPYSTKAAQVSQGRKKRVSGRKS